MTLIDKRLDGLTVEDGVIVTRGKFYRERDFVPYFYHKVKGRHFNYYERDPDDDLWYVCQVSEAERAAFPSLLNVRTVGIREQGRCVLSWTRSCLSQKER